MNIYQRINEVRKTVAYVKKDAEVQGYMGVTHDMVTAVVRDALVKQGIIVFPDLIGSAVKDAGQTQSAKPIIRFEATYNVNFVNAEDPSDKLVVKVHAHANDFGDKAPGKACSYAQKYALLKVFALETGENEESRVESDRQKEALQKHALIETQEYIDADEALGIFLLSQSLGDAWVDIFNAGQDGKKMERKKTLRSLEKVGAETYRELNQSILKGDALGVKELIEDIQPSVKRLLADKLGADKSMKLGELVRQ